MMNDDQDLALAERLRAMGSRPVEPAVRSKHLAAMAQVRTSSRHPAAARLGVALALIIGLLGASTGLAVAGVDAGPVSDLGKKVAGVVGIDITDGTVTHGTPRHYGTECLQVAEGKGAKNHGQYLKWVREHKPEMLEAAKASNCGKPLTSGGQDNGDD